jgi:hypothetical protein
MKLLLESFKKTTFATFIAAAICYKLTGKDADPAAANQA